MNIFQSNGFAKLKLFFFIPVLGMVLLTGCTSTSKTVTTESKSSSDSAGTTTVETTTPTKTEEKTTTTTTSEQKPVHHSLLGSFFNFLGEVIAFPFRVVGGAFDAIF